MGIYLITSRVISCFRLFVRPRMDGNTIEKNNYPNPTLEVNNLSPWCAQIRSLIAGSELDSNNCLVGPLSFVGMRIRMSVFYFREQVHYQRVAE